MDALARRYRHLLFAYPRTYRTQRGDELLGTLLDGAAPGQTRPTLADAADLMLGGLRQRLGLSVAADLEAGLVLAAPFALALAAGLGGLLWLAIEPNVDPYWHPLPGPFLTIGPAAYAAWLAAAVLGTLLPGRFARWPIGFAVAVTVLLIPAAAVTGYPRPPLWVILALIAFGGIALAGTRSGTTGTHRLAVLVGAVVATALGRELLAWQLSGSIGYYQPVVWLVGLVVAVAVVGVAAAGAVAAARGRPARPLLWAALLLALPGGWLGPVDTQYNAGYQPGFGRLAQVLLGTCLVLAAMTWLAGVRRRGDAVSALDRAGTAAVGCAGGLSLFLWLADELVFRDRVWPVIDWPVYLAWVLVTAVWPFAPLALRRGAVGLALLVMLAVPALQYPVPPTSVMSGLALLGLVALVAPGGYGSPVLAPAVAWLTACVAAVIAVYDNGWALHNWDAGYEHTSALVMTVVIVPLAVAALAGIRAVRGARRPVAGLGMLLTGSGWIGVTTLPDLASWGPILLLLPVGLAAVLLIQVLRDDPARPAALRAYADARQTDLLGLAYLLCGDQRSAQYLVERALAGAYRTGQIDDTEVRRRVVRLARRHGVPLEAGGDPLWSAVRRLHPSQRTALVLRVHAGLSPTQVAALMDRTEPAVDRLTRSALRRLDSAAC